MSNQYTAEEIKEILLDEGYRSVTILHEKMIGLKVDGIGYLIELYENGDIQLAYLVTNMSNLSLEKVNDWNSNIRFGCLYVEGSQLTFSLGIPVLDERLSRADIAKAVSRMLEAVRTIDILEFVED